MSELTKRQQEVLSLIRTRMDDSGYPPTIREIGKALSISSTNGVNDHLKALERKGYVNRGTGKSRALTLTEEGWRATGGAPTQENPVLTVSIPLVGRIAAGIPIDAVEQSDDLLHIDPSLLGRTRPEEVIALKVEGESMIEDGILDGDTIFVRRQATANRGETVAVLVDGAATVKRYYPEGSRIRLEPANETMEPIWISAMNTEDVAIIGKVIALYRQIAF